MVNVVSEITRNKIYDIIKENKRIDNRKFTEFRDVTIKTNYLGKTNGSSIVTIGNTKVIAGIKLQIASPFSNSPDEGILITNTELRPSTDIFGHGSQNKFAIEISRVIDRTIREAPLIDLNKLCVIENEKVWKINIDLHILNQDGNLIDAACLAAVTALVTSKMPSITVINNEIIMDNDNLINLPIDSLCLSCTVAKINGSLILDPISDEEKIMDTCLSVSLRPDGSLCSLQKSGNHAFKFEEIVMAISMAYEKSKEIFPIIREL
ncbi:MAG: exosome complex protein Rrp42 [Methanobacteriaceae archaeon]|nr:exosome complex protein Rrp42 [Methanobacteriaceae archaeon]